MSRTGLLLNNRYLLDQRIAGGGMGEVWKGTDTVLRRTVAVKVLLPALVSDAEFIARFRTEAQLMAALRHPGIAQVYDYGADSLPDGDRREYLVMEYVDGVPLGDRITKAGKLPAHETLSFVAQAAEALQVAHDAGIVHRDVKPNNLMVRPDGTVTLLDFGVARSLEVDGLTKTNQVIGSPQYMAPEQVAGQPVTVATDVYALGVVAYNCLSGRPPFTGENTAQVIAKVLYGEPVALPPDVPAPIAELVTRAMSRDPARRFATAAELAQAARAVPAGATTVAGTAARSSPPAAAVVPPRLSVDASLPTAAAAGPGWASSPASVFTAPPPTFPTASPAQAPVAGRPDGRNGSTDGSRKPLLAGITAVLIGLAAITTTLVLRLDGSSAEGSPSGAVASVSAAAALDRNAATDRSTTSAPSATGTAPAAPSAELTASEPPAAQPAGPTPASENPEPSAPAAPAPATTAPKVVKTEIDKAVAKSGKAGPGPCSATLAAGYACFQIKGSIWWVTDTKADGHSAVVFWKVGSGNSERKGQCANSMGNGKVGICNKKYAEGLSGTAKVCIMDWDTKQMHGCTANFRFTTS